MGRHEHHHHSRNRGSSNRADSDKKSRSRDETEEERLLRKAKAYVERHDRSRKDDHDSEASSPAKRLSRKYRTERSELSHKNSSRKRKSERTTKDKEDERRHRKKHSRDKQESSHNKSNKKKSKDERRQGKLVDKSKLYPLGAVQGGPPEVLLEPEKDYFEFHQHLWVYLYRDEGVFFGDLSSEEARLAFGRFVKRYNAGRLEEAYYDPKGLPPEAMEQCKTTRHKWSFQTNQTERDSLHILQEGVRKQTEYKATPTTTVGLVGSSQSERKDPPAAAMEPQARKTQEERLQERRGNRRLREHARSAEEELVGGKKDGRERMIEKRQEKAAVIHGAARDREEARMGGVELDDTALYGGGASDYQQALAREKQRKAQREQKKNARVAELQQKEQSRQGAMLQMLGLNNIKPGQRIQIKPRDDNAST